MGVGLEVARIENYQQFCTLREEWDELVSRSWFPHPQLLWDWFDAACQHGDQDRQLAILTVRKKGRLVGLAPLALREEPYLWGGRVRVRRLEWLSFLFSDAVDFILDAKAARSVLKVLWDYILQWDEWDWITLNWMTSMSPAFVHHFKACKQLAPAGVWTMLEGHPYLEISGDFPSYRKAAVKAKLLADLDRRQRRAKEEGIRFSYQVQDCWDDALLERLRQFNQEREAATGHRTFFNLPQWTQWIEDIRGRYNQRDAWRCHLLVDEARQDRLSAYAITFEMFNRTYYWSVGFHPDYLRYSVGKLLLERILEGAWQNGNTIFDFMYGAEEYKLEWEPRMAGQFRFDYQRFSTKMLIKRQYPRLWKIVSLRRKLFPA